MERVGFLLFRIDEDVVRSVAIATLDEISMEEGYGLHVMKLIIAIDYNGFRFRKTRKHILVVINGVCDSKMLKLEPELISKYNGIVELWIFSFLISENSDVGTLISFFSHNFIAQQARK